MNALDTTRRLGAAAVILIVAALASLPAAAAAAPTLYTGQAEFNGFAGADDVYLHSTITPGCEDAMVTYKVEWGTSAAYGNSLSKQFNSVFGSQYDDYIQVMGLAPGTLYHYRGSASISCAGGGGNVVGADRCFVAGQVQADQSYNVVCPGATSDPAPPSGDPAGSTGTTPTGTTSPTPTTTTSPKLLKVRGHRCSRPEHALVWPQALKSKNVKCRTIRKLFARKSNHGRLWASKVFRMRPGFKCVARSVIPTMALGLGLWKCSHGKRYFHMVNDAFGRWADKPFGPRFDPRL